jgi:cell division protein FtsB
VVAVVVLLAVVTLIIGALYLAQTTTSITTARDIRQLDQQKGRLERENELLRAEIARLNSLQNLEERAATLGFRPAGPDDILYLVVDSYVYNQPAPTPTLVIATPTPDTYEENFAGWLKRQFDALREQFRKWAG